MRRYVPSETGARHHMAEILSGAGASASNHYGEAMATLRVGAAYPDPPFNGMPDDGGLDIDLMIAIAEQT